MKNTSITKCAAMGLALATWSSVIVAADVHNRAASDASRVSSKSVMMARATWDTGWFQAEVLKQLLEELGYTVTRPKTYDTDDFYQNAARGEVDFWVNGWFPGHGAYLANQHVRDKVEPVGFLVRGGALQGYLVDKDTADAHGVKALADFSRPEIAKLFDRDGNGKADLIGCNTDWACAKVIEERLDQYGLRDTVEHVQGAYSPLISETIEHAERGNPVFFYAWTPHWALGTLVPGKDVVWIQDPEIPTTVPQIEGCGSDPCAMGFPANNIRAVGNSAFLQANPMVSRLLRIAEIPLEDISAQNATMIAGEDDEEDIRRHATEWIRANRSVVDTWLQTARAMQSDEMAIVDSADDGENADREEEQRPLRVVTKSFGPLVLYRDRAYTGFSIEIWDRVASEMGVKYEISGVDSVAKLLDEVIRGAADAATAGIGITSSRERDLDFSHAYFEAGLQIMVPEASGVLLKGIYSTILEILFSPTLFLMVVGFLLVLMLAAHLIWLAERRNNPEFPKRYFQGIWESLWWAAVTITTVGYGDKTPRAWIGRLFGLVWMVAGYFIFAYFTASITSAVTVKELQGEINGPSDLSGKRVATISHSAAAEYLASQGFEATSFERLEDVYPLLESGQVDALVYEAPVLQYYAAHEGDGKVKVVGLVFQEHDYGIALPPDSPYREQINLALLRLRESGVYQQIYEKWFGTDSAR